MPLRSPCRPSHFEVLRPRPRIRLGRSDSGPRRYAGGCRPPRRRAGPLRGDCRHRSAKPARISRMSGTPRYALTVGAAREGVMGVALCLFWLALSDRDAGTRSSAPLPGCHPAVAAMASSARVEPQRDHRAQARPGRCSALLIAAVPYRLLRWDQAGFGRLRRPVRRRPRPGARSSTRCSYRTDVDIAEVRGGLDGRLGGGSRRTHLAMARQRVRQHEERGDPRASRRDRPRLRQPARAVLGDRCR